MLIKHVTKKTFDVFFNNGWENWARFEIVKNEKHQRKLKQVAGEQIPTGIAQFLERKYGVI
jgi:uncharacterized membrane protein